MFAARGVVVSLAFFVMLYCALSSLVVLAWHCVNRAARKSSLGSASFLFALRIFSFAVSVVVAVFFAFPSFWLMESASLDEDAGTFILAACALLILSAGLVRLLRAQARTERAVKEWSLAGANAAGRGLPGTCRSSDRGGPALSTSSGAPALILVGIRKPQVMISDRAGILLTNDELQVAVRHELGHVRSRDNLKKALISATPFPGMSRLESAWREAAELAADDAAVANRQDALDLAAALIKLSRSSSHWSEPALASGLGSSSSAIGGRVERLLQWNKTRRRNRRAWAWIVPVILGMGMVVVVVSNYSATLVVTHRLTELLVP
jgi:beta-lactamase regulating signal transducer with metallopeptidase domain